MRKFLILLVLLALCFTHASADYNTFLGQPFPDFTATDSQGNTFTLSEALQDHDAVLINLWTTWCPPCEMEFPYLNEAYEKYGDRVAFVALSCEAEDTLEKIEAYRTSHSIQFPMGRDEGLSLFNYISGRGYPTTIIVDRFGNAAFTHVGSFMSAAEVTRLLEAFVGNGYTETTVLTEIPPDTSTRAFPVSKARALYVDNENVKTVVFQVEGIPEPQPAYVIYEDTAHLRFEIAATDNPAAMVYYNYSKIYEIPALLDAERNAYVFDQPMPGADAEEPYVCACLLDAQSDADYDAVAVYLLSGDESVEAFADELRSMGYETTWEYAADTQTGEPSLEAYLLHVMDQNGNPVSGMMVNFCTDTACVTCTSDENGTVTFDGAPDVYHVQMLKAPEGYSFDADFEMYTDSVYGEWVLRIRKN